MFWWRRVFRAGSRRIAVFFSRHTIAGRMFGVFFYLCLGHSEWREYLRCVFSTDWVRLDDGYWFLKLGPLMLSSSPIY